MAQVGGEIDIMESLGRSKGARNNGTVFGTYHWAKACNEDLRSGPNGVFPPVGAPAIDYSKAFHVFAVEWNATSIAWFVDGTRYWERHDGDRPSDPAHSAIVTRDPMYVILNTAIASYAFPPPGVPPAPRVMPVHHDVDWVRVYRRRTTPP